ncbi:MULTISPECIES: DUF2505 domain-containing protein [unclassified Schaalia]|uniref:DUF2505 domain-containing protein n=1 Tax=unclassified Schaalia TaxID=2691889 RepID=UPI001E34E8EE|nr:MULTISPECIES: DUF2505 domain-containing protein [unclassified Schaalia]MCD4550243.1 DUF2505 domain-containing protein [Schaalia sp. lx-260]MCD4558137.1 DUF2505 domain-containing protein [Schaalia sp. lx-100]
MEITIHIHHACNIDTVAHALMDPAVSEYRIRHAGLKKYTHHSTDKGLTIDLSIPTSLFPAQALPFLKKTDTQNVRITEKWLKETDTSWNGFTVISSQDLPFTLEAHQKLTTDLQGTSRAITATFTVHIPFFGRAIENFLAHSVEEIAHSEEKLIEEWLSEHNY